MNMELLMLAPSFVSIKFCKSEQGNGWHLHQHVQSRSSKQIHTKKHKQSINRNTKQIKKMWTCKMEHH